MSSKVRDSLICKLTQYCFILFCFFLTSCGLKTTETKVVNEIVEVQSAKCLTQSIQELKLYFKGDATEMQADRSFQCIQDVFVAFRDNIRGNYKDQYTPEEISMFLQKNFFQDSPPFTDHFLTSLMKFKVALVGGNEQFVRKSEITQLVLLVKQIQPDLVELNKSMKIISLNWNQKSFFQFNQNSCCAEKEAEFQQAQVVFSRVISGLMLQLKQSNRAYKTDDLVQFIFEMALFADVKSDTLHQIENSKELIKQIKRTWISGSDEIQGQDWDSVGLIVQEGLFQVLRYQYFIKDLSEAQDSEKWAEYQKISYNLVRLAEALLSNKPSHSFSNDDLYNLIKSAEVFDIKLNLNLSLLNEIGDFKVLFLGDKNKDRSIWSVDDFSNLKTKITEIVRNLHVLIINKNILQAKGLFQSNPSQQVFLQSEAEVVEAISALSDMAVATYDLNSLKDFIKQLSEGPFNGSFELPKDFDSLFDLAVALKTLMTEHTDNNLTAANVQLVFKVGIRAYFNYLQYQWFVQPYQFEDPAFCPQLQSLWEKISQTIQVNLKLKNNPYFPTDDILRFIAVLKNQNYISSKIQNSSIEKLLNGLWTHLLNKPEDRLIGKTPLGLNIESLNQITINVNAWIESQKLINILFSKQSQWNQNELVQEMKNYLTNNPSNFYFEEVNQFVEMVNSRVPFNFTDSGFLKILDSESGHYKISDATKSNAAVAVSRLFIRGYASDLNRVVHAYGLTQAELQTLFDQVKDIGVDLELLDKNNSGFISSRFIETNLFLSGSNGDEYANLVEMHDLGLHIVSGLNRASQLKKAIIKQCLPDLGSDVSDQTEVTEACLLQVYLTETQSFEGLPEFLKLKSIYIDDLLKDYYLSMLKAAGYIPNDRKVIRIGDASLFPHVVQYIEMIYARYDSNKNGQLDKDEALVAFPVFKKTIKDVAKVFSPSLKDENLPGTFIYLLKNTKPPKTLVEKLAFASFIAKPELWIIQTTRLDLGKIFNLIADSTKPSPAL